MLPSLMGRLSAAVSRAGVFVRVYVGSPALAAVADRFAAAIGGDTVAKSRMPFVGGTSGGLTLSSPLAVYGA